MSTLVRAGSLTAMALTAHTAVNLRQLRVPPPAGPVHEAVSVLLPLRDEAPRARACIAAALRAMDGLDRAELVVLDDGSTDGTAAVVAAIADPRLRLVTGDSLPAGWLGKPHACAQAAATADPASTVLIFLDADVLLAPDGLARTVAGLRESGLQLVSPYPRQLALGAAERLVQPLLQWSWLTFLPLRLAERSARPSLSAANGQLLAVDAAAYARAGGHGAVRDRVLDDIELLKAFKRSGSRGITVDGTELATCRMYDGWAQLRDGYAKSLWAGSGSPAGAAAVLAVLALAYLLPPLAFLRRPGDRLAAAGTAAGVAGRVLVARRVGARPADSLAHPLSVAVLGWLTALSWVRRRRGTAVWKGRPL